MPRLLHVVSHLDHDGASTQVRLLASEAVSRGEAVAVASLRRPSIVGEALRDSGVPVTWLQRRFAVDPFALRNLRRLVASWRPDMVQSWDGASAEFCRRAGVPWIHTARGVEPLPRKLGDAAMVIATAEAAADHIGEAAATSVVPNTFDPAIGPAADRLEARRRLRAEGFDIDDSTPLIVSVARIDDAKRIKEITWASDLVRVVCPGLRLLIVGEGPAKMACERFAAAATETSTVIWCGARDDLTNCLAAADVVWCASANGVAPTPAVEAMAAGKPLVLADGPGRDALVPDPKGADVPRCRVPWDDRAAWARATKSLLENPSLAEQIGQANVNRVRSTHDLQSVAATHAAAVRSAVGEKPTATL